MLRCYICQKEIEMPEIVRDVTTGQSIEAEEHVSGSRYFRTRIKWVRVCSAECEQAAMVASRL